MMSLGNNNAFFIAFLSIMEQGFYYRHTSQLLLLYYSPKAHLPEICICKNKVPFFLAACYKRLNISPTDMKLQLNVETNLLQVKYSIL